MSPDRFRRRILPGSTLSLAVALVTACGFDVLGPAGAPPAHCSNRATDEGESDVDCGGACGPCTRDKACFQDTDCLSSICDANRGHVCATCRAPTDEAFCAGRCGRFTKDCSNTAITCTPPGMKLLEGVTFPMGAAPPLGEEGRSTPVHDVTLSAFCLDVHEVTAGDYAPCAASGTCGAAKVATISTSDDSDLCTSNDLAGKSQHPVNCVTWLDADAYCRRRGARLPTEAEWEHAARGDSVETKFPWGSDFPSPDVTNGCGEECRTFFAARAAPKPLSLYDTDVSDPYATTAPVGQPPGDVSPLGIHDLGGNLTEWVQDWNAAYTADPVTNPSGPGFGNVRILRGGNFTQYDYKVFQTFWRSSGPPDLSFVQIGFRCARSLDR